MEMYIFANTLKILEFGEQGKPVHLKKSYNGLRMEAMIRF